MVPETRNTTNRGPEVSSASRRLPGPESSRFVTAMTRPPRPPGVAQPKPSAPGKAGSLPPHAFAAGRPAAADSRPPVVQPARTTATMARPARAPPHAMSTRFRRPPSGRPCRAYEPTAAAHRSMCVGEAGPDRPAFYPWTKADPDQPARMSELLPLRPDAWPRMQNAASGWPWRSGLDPSPYMTKAAPAAGPAFVILGGAEADSVAGTRTPAPHAMAQDVGAATTAPWRTRPTPRTHARRPVQIGPAFVIRWS